MFASVKSFGVDGIGGYPVTVEVNISGGLPAFEIVGLPDAAVKESRERVRAAIKNCGYSFPPSRLTVNLAPADKRKVGTVYDLPVLIGILAAQGSSKSRAERVIEIPPEDMAFIGELSLDGEVRPVLGALPMAIAARRNGIRHLFVPAENAAEAAFADQVNIYPVSHVNELIAHLRGEKPIAPATEPDITAWSDTLLDFSDVKGQENIKRAFEIAAAGGHNILVVGSPGAGKSMMAKRLPAIMPDMSREEMISCTEIYSVAGLTSRSHPVIASRPFRAPHHTVSAAGLAGGGSVPRPGEISLAHNGVLFLDELPEFSRNTMEVLRQPIEDGKVTISRVNATLSYPCSIMLIAAMNPCPCGYYGTSKCTCSPKAVANYLAKVSGPLLDRLDLHVEVPSVDFKELSSLKKGESSAEIKKRVDKVRAVQNYRFRGTNITCNARITPGLLNKMCPLSDDAMEFMKNQYELLGLSARAYDKLLKVARTIADIDESEVIKRNHIFEAVQFRNLDRKYWR